MSLNTIYEKIITPKKILFLILSLIKFTKFIYIKI